MMARKVPPPPPKREPTTEIDLSGASTPQQVIFKAMLLYLDTPGLSLRELWRSRRMGDDDTAPFYRDQVSWFTLERASIKQQWAKRREEHWAVVKRRVVGAMQTAAVERELAELRQLEGVESVVLSHIHGITDEHGEVKIAAVKPKSLEGAVGALVNLGKYRDKKRENVEEDVAARTVGEEVDAPVAVIEATFDDALSEEEVEAMAIAVARRRAGLIEANDGDDDGEE